MYMNYFEDMTNVKEYIQIAEGYDGQFLIDILKKYLKPGSTILELGMGPGKDLEILSQSFKVTGSDNSKVFLDLYKKRKKDADLLFLDARTIMTDKKFDCIYSNKVLIHLTREELKQSFEKQKEVLNRNGYLFHSFWKGNKEMGTNKRRLQQIEILEREIIERAKLLSQCKPNSTRFDVRLESIVNLSQTRKGLFRLMSK